MSDIEVPAGVKAKLLRDKLQMWSNTYFDAQVDVEVAEAVGDEAMREQAVERMKGALKAVRFLEEKLKEADHARD